MSQKGLSSLVSMTAEARRTPSQLLTMASFGALAAKLSQAVLVPAPSAAYPMLGLGTASGVRTEHVTSALNLGFRFFDTAQSYQWGYQEHEVGDAVPSPRIFIVPGLLVISEVARPASESGVEAPTTWGGPHVPGPADLLFSVTGSCEHGAACGGMHCIAYAGAHVRTSVRPDAGFHPDQDPSQRPAAPRRGKPLQACTNDVWLKNEAIFRDACLRSQGVPCAADCTWLMSHSDRPPQPNPTQPRPLDGLPEALRLETSPAHRPFSKSVCSHMTTALKSSPILNPPQLICSPQR